MPSQSTWTRTCFTWLGRLQCGAALIRREKLAMLFRVILSAASVAVALSLAPGRAEVLDLSYHSAVSGSVTWIQLGDPTPNGFGVDSNVSESNGTVSGTPILRVVPGLSEVDVFNEARGGGFEVQSPTSFSPDSFNSDRGALAVTVAPEPSSWAITLLGFAGLGL
jgi:hypothetical protein